MYKIDNYVADYFLGSFESLAIRNTGFICQGMENEQSEWEEKPQYREVASIIINSIVGKNCGWENGAMAMALSSWSNLLSGSWADDSFVHGKIMGAATAVWTNGQSVGLFSQNFYIPTYLPTAYVYRRNGLHIRMEDGRVHVTDFFQTLER